MNARIGGSEMTETTYIGIKFDERKTASGQFENDVVALRERDSSLGHFDRSGQLTSFIDDKGHIGSALIYQETEITPAHDTPTYTILSFSNQVVAVSTITHMQHYFDSLDADFSFESERRMLIEQIKYDRQMVTHHQTQITANFS